MIVETYEVAALSHERNTHELPKEIDRDQSRVAWPETTLNSGRTVDEFLWKGDPKATPIQRAGLVIYGLMFLLPFAGLIVLSIFEHDCLIRLIELIMATLCGIVSFRFLSNAFRHQTPPKVDR